MKNVIGRVVTSMSGCHMLSHGVHQDSRGSLSKVLSTQLQLAASIEFLPRELFWSRSERGVIRGMHTQLPPYAGAKLVWVSRGEVRDVVLDLRIGSSTFGGCLVTFLDDSSGGLFIPAGCAHGFEVLSEDAVMNYAQDVDYMQTHDSGIAWNSFSFDWMTTNPKLSERDRNLPQFSQFESPFLYSGS